MLCVALSFWWKLETENRKTDLPLGLLTQAQRSNLAPKSRQSLLSFEIALPNAFAKGTSRCRYIAASEPTAYPYSHSRKKNKNKTKRKKYSSAYLAKAFDPNCLRPELKFEYKKKEVHFMSMGNYLRVFCQFVLVFSKYFYKYYMKFDMG